MRVDPGIHFCLSVASLLVASCAHGRAAGSADAPTRVRCLGINGCAGQGECAAKATDGTELNACGGQNQCAGKGWVEVDAPQCQAKGGEVLAVVEADGAGCTSPSVPRLAADAATEHYNLGSDRLGIEGYDPVAYFPEGGGVPTPGRPELTHEHQGVVYRFASEDHRARFQADPTRYEPAYGGWCAYALGKNGRLVKVDPQAFLI
ncbi:MAG: hypothetical protein KDK70_37970, partial [Myxococcales bacterium]|nr:hypothetical protein [Myxococcales bacterium]